MNCPACNRNLALTLSVCPSCGTMVNDSVREELALKISPLAKPVKTPLPTEKPVLEKIIPPTEFKFVELNLSIESADELVEDVQLVEPVQPPALPVASSQTTQIMAKQTSPILVEFQTKKAVVPEWRLQLQNSVRRRNNTTAPTADAVSPAYQKVLVTSGATALKVENAAQPETVVSANPTLENAMRRIEQSRQKYLTEEKPKLSIVSPAQAKPFSYTVPIKNDEPIMPKPETVIETAAPVKAKPPISFNALRFEKFDTNKLPPLPEKVSTMFEKAVETLPEETKFADEENNVLQIRAAETPDVLAYQETTADEILPEAEGDDRAPMMARFNAGFFDLIIGSFLSLILLAPFTLANGNLFTFQGLLAFLATTSIVMFIYLTTTIGTMGRTIGMRLFSLELIDIEENAYPTFHQAAVSSSVYLVSLALGGVGFLTLFLNDEKRAAHDLISGTIVVKEYE